MFYSPALKFRNSDIPHVFNTSMQFVTEIFAEQN